MAKKDDLTPNERRARELDQREMSGQLTHVIGCKYPFPPDNGGAHYTDTIKLALIEAHGYISDAAIALGMTPLLLQARIAREPELHVVMENIRIFETDEAEKSLMDLVRARDPGMTKFKLTAHGKGRGYGQQPKEGDEATDGKPTVKDFAALAAGVASIAQRVAEAAIAQSKQNSDAKTIDITPNVEQVEVSVAPHEVSPAPVSRGRDKPDEADEGPPPKPEPEPYKADDDAGLW